MATNRDVRSGSGSWELTVAANDLFEGIGATGVVTTGHDWDWLLLSVDNTDAESLDQFDVQIQTIDGGDFMKLNTAWGTPTAHQNASTDLAVLGTTIQATARIRITGAFAFRIVGSSATAASDVDIEWVLTRDWTRG